MSQFPRLLVVAHGTASATGSATTSALLDAIAAARPSVPASLCFLDVTAPRLSDALSALPDPLVLVPLLLSTGYHVQTDIPAAVTGRSDVRIAKHLGPHPLLIDALIDRLPDGDGEIALVASGSSRPEAAAELRATADLLSERLNRDPVQVLTMADDLRAWLTEHAPARVATYLLAEGRFMDVLRGAARGVAAVAAPIGVHPALVQLVWARYDEALEDTGRFGAVR